VPTAAVHSMSMQATCNQSLSNAASSILHIAQKAMEAHTRGQSGKRCARGYSRDSRRGPANVCHSCYSYSDQVVGQHPAPTHRGVSAPRRAAACLQMQPRVASPRGPSRGGFFVIATGTRSLCCGSGTKRRHQAQEGRRGARGAGSDSSMRTKPSNESSTYRRRATRSALRHP
jgi:hypothetical protein